MKKSIVCMIIVALFSVMLLAACGKSTEEENGQPEATEEAASTESQAGDTAENNNTASGNNAEDSMVGEWVYICSFYHSEDSEGDYDSCVMSTDEESPDSAIVIRKDGEKYLIDYRFSAYESSEKIYGAELKRINEAAYRDAENTDWCMEMADPFEDEDNRSPHRFSLMDNGILVESREYLPDKDDKYSPYSADISMYMRKGSPELDDPENLGYLDTVTVSDTAELLNSIKSNRKIIVKEGTYNFTNTSIPADKISNRYINPSYAAYEISGVSNLCIEAEEGAKVLFCIDDPYDPVMSFVSGGHIRLKGITAGHNVEPGHCSGSVLSFNDINGLDIDSCSLYGSGTYGIEALYTYDINVKDTEIYECTYGLVSLMNTGVAEFEHCVMRDSSELSMINVNGGYDVTFEDCEFKNNRSLYESNYFVEMGEYDHVIFKKCSFSNNKFYTFSNREVIMEDCTYDNNYAAFSDLIKSTDTDQPLDKDTILKNYDKVLKKQEEIDSKLNSDSLMDQMTLNQTSAEEYNMWDTLLNQVWQYLEANLDEKEMGTLKEEQQKWVKEKEKAMKDAGAEFEGGSMQPMVEYGAGSASTRKRTELLISKYF